MDCETNRVQNDNFRLDMTWADQQNRQEAIEDAVENSCELAKVFHSVFLNAQDMTQLALLQYEDIIKLSMTCRVLR